jgi:hypothetical protein
LSIGNDPTFHIHDKYPLALTNAQLNQGLPTSAFGTQHTSMWLKVCCERSADVRNRVAMDLANNAVCQSTGIMSIPVAHHGLVMPFSGTHTV